MNNLGRHQSSAAVYMIRQQHDDRNDCTGATHPGFDDEIRIFSEQLSDRLWDPHSILSNGYRGLSPQEHLSVGPTFSTNIVKRFLIYFFFYLRAEELNNLVCDIS
jgi:hypothetical protein